MGFIHGLAIALIMFEGIIIQCKDTPSDDLNSIDWIEDAPIIDVKGNKQFLPDELIEVIVSKSDLKTVKTAVRSRIVNATDTVMSEILRNRIILITPHQSNGITSDYYEHGELFLRFGSYRGLVSLFDRFGDQVKKIEINYVGETSRDRRIQINQNIINRYAKNFEELRMVTDSGDEGIWEEISSGGTDIIFPEVKKFQFYGKLTRNEFKLDSIFPQLECLYLFGAVKDINCLANITTLKELMLRSFSIEEHQLDHIFANNKNMTKLNISSPKRAETLHAIAKDLTKLEILQLGYRCPDKNFLFRSNDREKYELSSVTHFDILFYETNELTGDLSFDMPHLKKLTLRGSRIDNDQVIDFINYFKELETVELLSFDYYYNPIKCIETLKHIKEFTAKIFENSKLNSLQKMFKHFDKESKLQTLKLLNYVNFGDDYQKYEHSMNKINIILAKSKKPTWRISEGEENGTGRKYLMFKRRL